MVIVPIGDWPVAQGERNAFGSPPKNGAKAWFLVCRVRPFAKGRTRVQFPPGRDDPIGTIQNKSKGESMSVGTLIQDFVVLMFIVWLLCSL